jgi:hypothetical protein
MCPKFCGKTQSKNFPAEIEFYKIDPCGKFHGVQPHMSEPFLSMHSKWQADAE